MPFRDRPRQSPAHRWQRRPSPLSRYALLAYALIVVDASLYPFDGWRDLGLGAFDYLSADWPRRALPFDVAVNAIGYAPLGFLTVLALHPRVRGVGAIVLATLFCAALSVNLEAVQTYLPARVASNVDLASNVAGGFLGALGASRAAHVLLDTGRLRMWRARWFATDASRGLVLVLVWFGALVYPDVFVFGTGGLLKVFDPERAANLAALVGFANDDIATTASRFERAEAAVGTLTLFGAGMLFFGLLRGSVRWWLRVLLLAAFVVATVAVAALAHAFLFDEAVPWPLLTPGARSAIGIAALALVAASPLPFRIRWALGFAALIGAIALVNVYPDNPYVGSVGLSWTRGKLMNFYGLASGVNLVWPFFAIAYLVRHRAPSIDAMPRRSVAKSAPPPPL